MGVKMTDKDKKNHNKSQKFKDLVKIRVPKAMKSLKLVQNLSNTYNYEYTDDEVRKITSALKSEYDDLAAAFKKGLKKGSEDFTL